uniref:SGNH hydrolase-type esterase domain-containing protein n=1 Tax=Odontella aurita TaxID=265563 RepID=A0A7S4INA9_9STRA|mmetsp:Transcript_27630/g.81229  ORF Transcript_27630/g.81229 Transcript_27630/m.81229 type:complete len:224 (+) Transcript_27630:268-939(+)
MFFSAAFRVDPRHEKGGKYLFQSMSPRVRCHFITGTMYSFASGRRPVDLRRLGVRGGGGNGGEGEGEAVLFSYGEIDVRCHVERLSSERECDYAAVIRSLVEQYMNRIVGYLSEFGNDPPAAAVVLAIPPPSDRNENPRVPYYGKLSERVVISRLFNRLLEEACGARRNPNVHFFHPFAGFTGEDGSLDHNYSDGHIHIRSQCCRPIHHQLTALLERIKQQRQ